MQGVGRRPFEPEVVIEACRLRKGVGGNGSHPYRVRNLIAAKQRVLKQRPAESPPLVLTIHGQTGKHDDRDRSSRRLALEEPLRGVIRLNLSDRQRVKADYFLPAGGDKGSCRAGGLGVSSVALQPAIEGHLAGNESGEVVRASQRLRPRIAHCQLELFEDARLAVEATKAVGDSGRPLEHLRELVPMGRGERELLSVREDALSFRDSGAADEAAVADRAGCARGANECVLRVLYSKIPTEGSIFRRGGHGQMYRHCTDALARKTPSVSPQAGGSRLTPAASPTATRVIA